MVDVAASDGVRGVPQHGGDGWLSVPNIRRNGRKRMWPAREASALTARHFVTIRDHALGRPTNGLSGVPPGKTYRLSLGGLRSNSIAASPSGRTLLPSLVFDNLKALAR